MTSETKNKNEIHKAPYNFYHGGKYGKIDTDNLNEGLISQRVVSDDNFATICFVGYLPGSSGMWLGVDWDDELRGRHDGSYNGIKYFATHSPKSGSFVRPSKVSLGLTFEETITKRYGSSNDPAANYVLEEFYLESSDSDDECGTNSNIPIIPSNMHGHQRVKVNISGPANCAYNATCNQIDKLKYAVLHSLPVARPLDLSEGGGNMGIKFPLIEELDCARTLVSDWWQVAQVCRQLPLLRTLNISDNKMLPPLPPRDMDRGHSSDDRRSLYNEAFRGLVSLIVVRLCLSWSSFLQLFEHTPSLDRLCLAYNKLSVLQPCLHRNFVNIRYLDLACNCISNFEDNVRPFGELKHLETLLLNDNRIENLTLPGLVTEDSDLFPRLTLLAISNNSISSWTPIHHIARLRALKELIFMFNPIIDQQKNPETARQDVIAKLPRVKTLNRNDVKYDERKGAEIDYLKRYGKKWLEVHLVTGDSDEEKERKIVALEEFMMDHPRFSVLVNLYGAPEQSEMKEASRKLKEGLIEVMIEFSDQIKGDCRSLKKKLPSHMTVQHLRVLLRKLCKIPAKYEFSLCYVSSTRPCLEIPLEAETREIGFYNVQTGDRVLIRPAGS